jgi:hypothetical protein
MISMDPSFVVDAVMRGQEDVVMNILRADPSYLLKKAEVKNSVGVEYEATPLQAAIIANDVQMVERMQEHFTRLITDLKKNPIDGIAEMHRQIKEIYKLSLQKYLTILENKLTASNSPQETNNQAVGGRAYNECKKALESDDINQIFKTHNLAQENNAFDFSPYVDAILNASQAELNDVMALIYAKTKEETDTVISRTGVAAREASDCRDNPFDQLTLVQKLNRFRERFVKHMQQEIIFNPNHILAGLKSHEAVWDTLPHGQDPNHNKRSIIFSQLCGWAQRNAAEPVKQDIRQGTYYLAKETERRSRQSRFNDSRNRNSVVDVSLSDSSIVDGSGYKFAADAASLPAYREWAGRGIFGGGEAVQNLCRAKTSSFQNLLRGECSRLVA